jgi:3'-phosphoadenosine 5'-phosphosulfate sulfotransferase (PAPS reductase)/FAD synthetase
MCYWHLKWCELRGEALNVKVVFSDTGLEVNKLYHLIDCVKEACKGKVEFIQTKPDITRSYWVTQFGLGYPVPTYRNRWCTNNLKVRPMKAIPGIALTGVHLGESSKRDKRIKDCRDGECGLSDLSNGLEPISEWGNCDVWDYITMYIDGILYQGCCDNIMDMYEIAESQTGSLRMGCFHCPVVVAKRIQENVDKGIVPEYTLGVRGLIEKLREAVRINAPKRFLKSGDPMPGAIHIEARRAVWKEMSVYFPAMLLDGFIRQPEIDLVNTLLDKGSYPPTYPLSWIDSEHQRLE